MKGLIRFFGARRGWRILRIFCFLMISWRGKAEPNPKDFAATVTIYRDNYGVPHIDGPTDAAVVFGFGYSQAEDYFWQVEDSYIQALGRYAEIYGESGLEADLLNRSFEIVPRSKADFEKADPDVKTIGEAFAAGLNYYLEKHPEVKPRLITHFEPWMPSAFERNLLMSFLYGQTHYSRGEMRKMDEAVRANSGSNTWAIGPSKTKSGHAMLFCNPHQPWFGWGQFIEGHLHSAEGLNFSGATIIGGPLPNIGHNEYLGWSHTTNDPDVADVWRETFDDPKNPLNYKHGAGYKTATEWNETIKVLNKSGQLEERNYTFRKTHHGPIVGQDDPQHRYSANIAKLSDGNRAREALLMDKAKNFKEFYAAMSRLDLQMFNTAYADKEGNIFYLYNAAIPKRDRSFDWTRPVDGSDPRTDWGPVHPIEDLPQVLNPKTGYVQNCNSTPFMTTDDDNPSVNDFPHYMCEDQYDDKRRAKMSRKLLREAHDVTFEDWQKLGLDTTLYWPMDELPKFKRDWEELKTTDPTLAEKVAPYLQFLLDWDCKASVDSPQATLCVEWYSQIYEGFYPAETPKKMYLDNPKMKFDALLIAAEKLKAAYGSWQVPWGEIHRIQRHADVADMVKLPFSDSKPSVPCPGVNGPLGVAFTVYYSPPLFGRKKYYGVVGNSYMAMFEFTDKIKAVSLLQFGESGHPDSPHFFDQAKMLSEKKFKPAWFYWEDVLANTEAKYHPGEEPKR